MPPSLSREASRETHYSLGSLDTGGPSRLGMVRTMTYQCRECKRVWTIHEPATEEQFAMMILHALRQHPNKDIEIVKVLK